MRFLKTAGNRKISALLFFDEAHALSPDATFGEASVGANTRSIASASASATADAVSTANQIGVANATAIC
jgi:hypothetical protein